jgi:uncharacterized protein Veg
MGCSLQHIRDAIHAKRGARVRFKSSRGRKKIEVRQGVILDTYPKVFTLYVESHKSTVSFSYAELLTHELELELVSQAKKGGRCVCCIPQEKL